MAVNDIERRAADKSLAQQAMILDITNAVKIEMQIVIQEVLLQLHSVKSAFPKDSNGEPEYEGHKTYHEARLKEIEARTDFTRKLTFEITKWGLLGFLGWLGVQLFNVGIESLKIYLGLKK